MSEKRAREERALGITRYKAPEPQYHRQLRVRHTSVRKFKNKKHTIGRLKRATYLNNRNNRTDICGRGTMTPEEYENYKKYLHA